VFAALYKSLPADSAEVFYQRIKNKTAFKTGSANAQSDCATVQKPLEKVRIMIDPGHMAGNLNMAHLEQKYLHFTRGNYPALRQDSLDIAEGMLTWQTASILKKMLEEKGATVAFTRKENGTSFGCSYDEWFRNDKEITLDSLFALGKITAQKHKRLWKLNKATFFLEFFKDYELLQRSRVINAYRPDLTVIIHYNVNEKNVPWQKPSDKDFCMAFVPGCLIADNLESPAGKMNFLRLLLSTDVNKSEQISALLVSELNQQLNVPIAKTSDATYLSEHCLSTKSAGVYCRNLALCRLAQSPLMYGECLYQDDEQECYQLIDNSENKFGIQTNKRVVQAAQAFYNAIVKFYAR
jgi:N-acetylmuramoyl-L-alanine amidase